MNTTLEQGLLLASQVVNQVKNAKADVVLCPPFTHLAPIAQILENTDVQLGAQNVFWGKSGAYTGEISTEMLTSVGCQYVIIGHSERRQYFKETDSDVNKKLLAALEVELIPIVAMGETLEEREQNKTEEKVKSQVTGALDNVESLQSIIFAYEPIWAIGTGKNATPEEANDVIRHIRAIIGSLYSPDQAKETKILYGGSVSPDNIDSLMAEPDIDGALVGGASLQADSFTRIINFKKM